MRIIAGSGRGKKLFGPPGRTKASIRPTADRAREAVFSIIGDRVEESQVLDLFAGTGALGLEAVSRGAAAALFVDNNRLALDLLQRNITACSFADRVRVIRRDLERSLSFLKDLSPPGGFSLVFLDPPYGKGLAGRILAGLSSEEGLLSKHCLVIAEDNSLEELPDSFERLYLSDRRIYGDTGFWFYEMKENTQI